MLATCTNSIGRGSMPAMMMPWRTPLAVSLALVCVMISRRCARNSAVLYFAAARLMISAAMTVLPLPVGATSSGRAAVPSACSTLSTTSIW
jgi:hypothetical protein